MPTTPEDAIRAIESVPLLDCDEIERAEQPLRSLCAALERCGYRQLAYLPTAHSPWMLPREPLTLYHALRRDRIQLFRASALPSLHRRLLSDEAEALTRILFHGAAMQSTRIRAILGDELVEALREARVFVDTGSALVSMLRVVPLPSRLLLCDRPHHRHADAEPVWFGADSLTLMLHLECELTGQRFARGIDLCSGSGVQAFALAPHVDEVRGVDLNPRAVALARISAGLRPAEHVSFVCGDLAGAFDDEPYDVVASNPPFVAMPESERGGYLDGYGGPLGLDMVERILAALSSGLSEGGRAYLIFDSPVVGGRDLAKERLKEYAREQRVEILMSPLQFLLSDDFAQHQVANGIERLVVYIARITRTGRAGLEVGRMPPLRGAITAARVRRLRQRLIREAPR